MASISRETGQMQAHELLTVKDYADSDDHPEPSLPS